MKNKTCPFCIELKSPEENLIKKDRKIIETKNFVVFPTIGGFIDNYQLIVPKKHIQCFGELTKTQCIELNKIIKWQEQINKKYFNCETSIFEHGSKKSSNPSGKSIVHAHFHIFPNNKSLLKYINKKDYDIFQIEDISDLSNICNLYNSYLYYRDIDGKSYVIIHQGLPSQFLRKILADSVGFEKWDWREYPMLEKVEQNIEFYRKHIEILNELEENK